MYLHHHLFTVTILLCLTFNILALPTKLKNPFRSKPKKVDKAIQVPHRIKFDIFPFMIGDVYTNDFDRYLHTDGAMSDIVNYNWEKADPDIVNPKWIARSKEEKRRVATKIRHEWANLPIEQRKDTWAWMFETEMPEKLKGRLEEPGEDLKLWEAEFVRRVFLGSPEEE